MKGGAERPAEVPSCPVSPFAPVCVLLIDLRAAMIDQLYEKVGGSQTMKRLVDRFYDLVLADPSLAPFFPDADMNALRSKQVMFITMLVGKSRTFTGRDLTTAHADARGRGLSDEHFNALLGHFDRALRDIGVEEAFIRELVALVETTRDAVLGRTQDQRTRPQARLRRPASDGRH
jgi:hemoglobin